MDDEQSIYQSPNAPMCPNCTVHLTRTPHPPEEIICSCCKTKYSIKHENGLWLSIIVREISPK